MVTLIEDGGIMTQVTDVEKSQAVVGFVSAFFLGIWGIIIGFVCYKDGSYGRKSFFKGYCWTIGITIGAVIAVGLFAVIIFFAVAFFSSSFVVTM